jgi:hypothetical protein
MSGELRIHMQVFMIGFWINDKLEREYMRMHVLMKQTRGDIAHTMNWCELSDKLLSVCLLTEIDVEVSRSRGLGVSGSRGLDNLIRTGMLCEDSTTGLKLGLCTV